jgi:microcystin-dependent protein
MLITQNVALYSLLGTRYGGDGKTTFGLPNLMGRVAVGAGAGPGLTPRSLGDTGGVETVTLMRSQIPVHKHEMKAAAARTPSPTPSASTVLSSSGGGTAYAATAPTTPMSDTMLSTAEGYSQPHENRMPYLTVNFCIALEGIFPPRP